MITNCWISQQKRSLKLQKELEQAQQRVKQRNEKNKRTDPLPTMEEITSVYGSSYRNMMKETQDTFENYETMFPALKGKKLELAGFVWFQGFNDQFSPAFRDNYKNNMIAFVNDVRKEYEVPKMPFVIGVMGTGVTKEGVDQNAVSVAQREAAAAPEFKGNAISVESYPFYAVDAFEMFRKDWTKRLVEFSQIASDRPYHYMGSGKFFVSFGDALAGSMAELLPNHD